jgi:general stress protein YciG
MGIKDRGFASMNAAKQREIASKGGKAAHVKGTAHQWTTDEARAAGALGGKRSAKQRTERASKRHVD